MGRNREENSYTNSIYVQLCVNLIDYHFELKSSYSRIHIRTLNYCVYSKEKIFFNLHFHSIITRYTNLHQFYDTILQLLVK